MNPLERHLLWFVGGTLTSLALAWIAFQVQQQQIAPAVLFPLAVGGVLGAALRLLQKQTQLGNLALVLACVAAWGLLLVVMQDYIGHRLRLRAFDEQIAASHPLAAAIAGETGVRPTFGEHLKARVRSQPVWWSLDVILIVAAACGAVAIGSRRPKELEQQGLHAP